MQLHVCLFLHTKRVQILPTMPWFWRCPVLQCATFRSRQLSRKHHKIWLLDRYPFWGQNFEGLHCRFKATDGLPTWGTTKEKSYIPYQYSSQPRSVPIFHQKLAPFKQWKPRTGRLVRKRACYCAGLNSKVIWTRSWGDVKFSTSFEACASGNLHDKGYSAWLQVTKGKPLDFSHDRYIYIYIRMVHTDFQAWSKLISPCRHGPVRPPACPLLLVCHLCPRPSVQYAGLNSRP